MKSGVYTITNIINNKIYVGSCISNTNQRLSNHKNELKRGIHNNKYLQRSFNKYGIDNFKFEILEYHDKEYCISMEQYWINMLNVCNKKLGYNICPKAGNCRGKVCSEETKKKIGDKAKIRCKGEGNPRYGTVWSKETRGKIENSTRNKAVLKLDKQGNIIQEYKSLSDAGKDNNIYPDHIIKVCKNKPHHITAGGFKWKYKNEEV